MSSQSPSPDPDEPRDLPCEEARRRIHDFALGDLAAQELRELRQHVVRCAECGKQYKESIETTAALAHVTREEREAAEAERQKRRLHAERFGPTPKTVKHRRHYRLRIALIPAFFILVMLKVTGLGEPPARVDIVKTDGTVHLEGKQVLILDEPLLVLPGRWVHTKAFSTAQLESREMQVSVQPRTSVLLESARPVRMRLRHGQLDVDGDLDLYTVLGFVKVSAGKGRVTLNDEGLSIEPESGDWILRDKTGERQLTPGEPYLVRTPILAAK